MKTCVEATLERGKKNNQIWKSNLELTFAKAKQANDLSVSSVSFVARLA